MKSYLRHPALRSPGRWIQGPKKLDPSLYQTPPYQGLATNPFALALSETRADCQGHRLPMGNMVQLTMVERDNHYAITPVLQKLSPAQYFLAASYIVSNEQYIASRIKRAGAFIPRKWNHYNPRLVSKKKSARMADDMAETIRQHYVKALEKELSTLPQDSSTQQGYTLTSQGPLLRYENGNCIINLSLVLPEYQGSQFVPFTNTTTSRAIFNLVNY
ncbi:hypothetical protein DICA4_D06634 [Diutina catenulata]